MNVTVLNGTAQSNLRVFPANVDTPNASNLNWLAGQSPTPNKVDVQPSPDGKIKLFNFAGTVDVLGDVVGYYSQSNVVRDFELVIEDFVVDLDNKGETEGRTAFCPEGKLVTGGGVTILNNNGLELKGTVPDLDMGGWSGSVIAEDSPDTGTMSIYAICAAGVTIGEQP
jgi:hypothetical protein